MQKELLIPLQDIAPDLASYQAGSIAAAQIISNGKYVLTEKYAREIKKFQTVLSDFIQGTDPEKPRIASLDDISADTVQELLIYLKEKGYQQRNIQAEFGARILHNPSEIRENLSNLSTPSL